MKILTIIVSYNFVPWMDRCLGSLRASECHTDVMVLDNASSDGTTSILRKNYPEVMLVENGANLGFGRANNIGMNYALSHSYDAVLLLNQDAWIDADTLGNIAKQSLKHPDYGILSPIHLTGNRSKLEHGFAVYSGLSSPQQPIDAEVKSVPFIDAAIWFIPTTVLRKVGLFSPLFYHYGEDKDFANRILYYSFKIGFLPGVYGCHDREFRAASKAAVVRSERVYMLSELSNIRLPLPRAFAMSVLATCKKLILSLLQPSRYAPLTPSDFLSIVSELLHRWREIMQTRKKSQFVDLSNYKE